jgi:hypothetical protein
MVICKPVTPILECPSCPATWDFQGVGVRGLEYTVPMHVRVAFKAPAMLCAGSQKKLPLTFWDNVPPLDDKHLLH